MPFIHHLIQITLIFIVLFCSRLIAWKIITLALFIISNWCKVSVNPPNLKKPLTKAEFEEVLSSTCNSSDRKCECFNYHLINDHYTFKNVQIIFKFKNRFTCNTFNLTYIVICDTCKEEYIGGTNEGKTKLRDRARVHR